MKEGSILARTKHTEGPFQAEGLIAILLGCVELCQGFGQRGVLAGSSVEGRRLGQIQRVFSATLWSLNFAL